MENIRVILADMPTTIKGYTIYKDDYYTIVLNSNLSHQQNRNTYLHELGHIETKDFDKSLPVGMIEIIAHGKE